MKKIIKKIEFTLAFLSLMFTYSFCTMATSSGGSAETVAKSAIEEGLNFVAVIPGAMSVLAFVNAGIAYAQSQQEGGNAQASARMSNNIVAGIVCAAITLFVAIKGKSLILQLIGS